MATLSSTFQLAKQSNEIPAGTFGRVLECWDRKNKDYVAIKIVRNVQKYRDAAMIEVHSAPHKHNLLPYQCKVIAS